jgi:hypothetical protein
MPLGVVMVNAFMETINPILPDHYVDFERVDSSGRGSRPELSVL